MAKPRDQLGWIANAPVGGYAGLPGDQYLFSTGGYLEARRENHDRVLAQLSKPPQLQQPGNARQIAVTHGFTLRLPSDEVAAVHQRHLAECAKLLTAVCRYR